MARVNLLLSDELEKEFRQKVFERYGMKKGNIAKAIEEAITEWVERDSERRQKSAK
jgi:hypothetical protein